MTVGVRAALCRTAGKAEAPGGSPGGMSGGEAGGDRVPAAARSGSPPSVMGRETLTDLQSKIRKEKYT